MNAEKQSYFFQRSFRGCPNVFLKEGINRFVLLVTFFFQLGYQEMS